MKAIIKNIDFFKDTMLNRPPRISDPATKTELWNGRYFDQDPQGFSYLTVDANNIIDEQMAICGPRGAYLYELCE